jgi:hypothetical protein
MLQHVAQHAELPGCYSVCLVDLKLDNAIAAMSHLAQAVR